ncbi:MAG: hypothetical protein ABSB25_09295 [Sedimentisphaerales bacterium]|jgi:hypothetical protein
MFKRNLSIQLALISILVIIKGTLANGGEDIATKPQTPQITNLSLHGFNFTAWEKDWWGPKAPVDEGLRFALDEGANFLAMDWPVNFNNDGTIVKQGGPLHPCMSDIKTVIDKAKAMKFYVMLKPHVTMAATAQNRNIWNTDVNEFRPSNFFPAWKTYLAELAAFAALNKVDAICIGTELNHVDWRFRDEWINLIDEVRLRFSGQLTYDAIFSVWDNVKDVNEVIFWDKLDFIGCSLYVPLTRNDNASIESLKMQWANNSVGSIGNVITYLRNISKRYNKELMALEGGYQSVSGGLYAVNDPPSPGKMVNNDLQSRGLEAYLNVLYGHKGNWLKGVSLWQITPMMMTPGAVNTIWHTQEFTVYKKPASEVVKKYYTIP